MNKEIREILGYLEDIESYVIWAGFARFAHLGLKSSPDVDIYTGSRQTLNKISTEFQQKGWKIKQKPVISHEYNVKLEKKGVTFDIFYSEEASKLFFQDKVKIKLYGYRVNVISLESLFLTKLGQLSSKNRPEEKLKKDLETVYKAREKIDIDKVRKLAAKLPDSFWKTGWI